MKSAGLDALPALPEALRAKGITLRPATNEDLPLVAAWHAAFRAAGFGASLAPAQLEAFLADQFRLHQIHCARTYPAADRWLACRDGTPVGQIHVDRSRDDWRLIDLLLAPHAQGAGLGAELLAWLQAAAIASATASITLGVAFDNARALALYRKTGFVEEPSDVEIALAMRWRPAPAT